MLSQRRELTMVQYPWNPGNAGMEATKLGDSPSFIKPEAISCVSTTIDWGEMIEFFMLKLGHSEQHNGQA